MNLTKSSSTICFEADTIQSDLVVLAELYICMEELFHSPLTQKTLVHYISEWKTSGRSILWCAIRRKRRRGDLLSIERSIATYERFRKKAKKEITKQLSAMKRMEHKIHCLSHVGQQDQCIIFLARVLREANTHLSSTDT
ncbi:hypothetical protein Lal_00012279 [Lupinus albus]|nr:hypothetical protein Lal_00012279 [Lupinus albus]